MGAILDLVKVLYDPAAVFQRVTEKPAFLMPFIGISVVQILISALNLPFLKVAMQAQAAQAPAGAPDPSRFAAIGLIFVPVGIAIVLVIVAFVLWVLVSLVGGEAKFGTLLSVAAYAAVPSVVVLGIIGTIVLHIQGPGNVTSPQDLQPALGLDLLAPGAKGFLGAVLKGINPFSIWGLVLTAIGVSTTHRLSKGSGYMVATGSFVLGLLIAGTFGALFTR
ncbi:MAG TPA: YIP1 family protein [Gemmatimonadales bacterium]|nr:YIP1 family protein [Gemmatimonadales bacterium]